MSEAPAMVDEHVPYSLGAPLVLTPSLPPRHDLSFPPRPIPATFLAVAMLVAATVLPAPTLALASSCMLAAPRRILTSLPHHTTTG